MSICLGALAANGVPVESCDRDDDLCTYHIGVADAGAAAVSAVAQSVGVRLYVADELDPECQLWHPTTGEIQQAHLGALIAHIAAAIQRNEPVRVVPMGWRDQ